MPRVSLHLLHVRIDSFSIFSEYVYILSEYLETILCTTILNLSYSPYTLKYFDYFPRILRIRLDTFSAFSIYMYAVYVYTHYTVVHTEDQYLHSHTNKSAFLHLPASVSWFTNWARTYLCTSCLYGAGRKDFDAVRSITRDIRRSGPWKSRLFWVLKWQRANRVHWGPKKSRSHIFCSYENLFWVTMAKPAHKSSKIRYCRSMSIFLRLSC